VVHAHGLRAGAAAALALAGGAARRTALAVTVHNGPPSGAGAAMVYAGLERLVASRADAVLTVSGDLADRMRRLGARDAGRAVVPAETGAPPGAAIAADLRSELGAMDRPIVLAVGRLAEQKGLSTLLTAAARWQYRRPVPLLVIAGEGPLASLLAEQARVQGVAVMFLGNRADVPALLAAADVVVVPSVWEGQPLIVQEALRAGRPLVASRVGGIPDLTGLGGALLVPPSDPAQLAAAVTRVLDRPDLAATLSAAASARAQLLPTREQAIQQAMSLYRRLSAERGARP
jgi:glycosyltransferase involved in cell wall biosynthesis